MRFVTSPREGRLWTWTAAVVVAILATLGLARTIADELQNRRLVDHIFFWTFVASLAAGVLVALRLRPGGVELGVWLGVACVYTMAFLRMGTPIERSHLVEYGIVAVLAHEALLERAEHRSMRWPPAVIAAIATAVVGVADECIQIVLPSRVFDPIDIVFNVLAATMAVAASAVVRWASRRRRSQAVRLPS